MTTYVFNGMMSKIEGDRRNRFLMYPRFIQCLINHSFSDGPIIRVLRHDEKVFAYLIRRNEKIDLVEECLTCHSTC